MAERIEGYNDTKDYTGFVCRLASTENEVFQKLNRWEHPFLTAGNCTLKALSLKKIIGMKC
ncbi:hypothetical protein [Paenibacillus donghaensis]|uniref:Uncharacterized protein n=1 Tax=Paenibacillus donghaensis TaxID=414771 RepID=A0A2Z2KN44_9BACL|nr:hypothetical protein [Paenibacillus donghaensis]ASA22592.1 hypothetical protein B9T62_18470 [Paenibacillus donghaensis]